jgi:hypothetical protein
MVELVERMMTADGSRLPASGRRRAGGQVRSGNFSFR